MNHVSYYMYFVDVTVLHGGRGHIARSCEQLGVPHVQIPMGKFYKIFWGFWKLVFELRRLKPDLLVLHGQWAGPVGVLAGKLAGVRKMIYVCHWPAFYTDWDLWRCFRNYLSEMIPCRLVDRVYTISESNRYQYLVRRLVPEDRLFMIPNPIELESIPTAESARKIRQRHSWSDECCNIVSVGRLSSQKRVDWLLDSWVEVQRRCPQARLWIVGDGEEEAMLKAQAKRLNLDKTCVFLGAQSNGWDYIAASDFVVMTSLYEARGNVVVEAMACGKAVVANQVDGVCDSMSDGREGFLVEPGDIQGLTERLCQLIEQPELRLEMGKRGLQTIARFSKPVILQEYLTNFEQLLTGLLLVE